MNAVVVELAMLGLALIAWAYARWCAQRAAEARSAAAAALVATHDAVQVSLVLARAVLDSEDVDKYVSGAAWVPRDDLEQLLHGMGPVDVARALINAANADRKPPPTT